MASLDEPAPRPPAVAPYGAWRSPISVEVAVGQAVRLGEPRPDGSDLYWLEGRPAEGGRVVLVRRTADGAVVDLTPAPLNVRSRVHEYGGGAYVADRRIVVGSDFADGRLRRIDPDAGSAVPITPAGPWRYADLRIDLARGRVLAVREDHSGSGEPVASIVAIPLAAEPSAGTILVEGRDFFAAPRLAPDGRRLAWLAWSHPNMPWDGCELWVGRLDDAGMPGDAIRVAGGPSESICQPEWTADGRLVFASDRTGWWNLYRWDPETGETDPLAPAEIEFADPAWVFDRSSYAVLPGGSIVAAGRREGRDRLYRIPSTGGRPEPIEQPYTEIEGLRATVDGSVVFVGASPSEPPAVVVLDPEAGVVQVVRRSTTLDLDPALAPPPEPITFPTAGGEVAHALFYPPANPDHEGPPGERPPLVVNVHGGPTSSASTALNLAFRFMTSRGIAIVDVDYRGSTGYGRPYRDRLAGSWGIVDVEDAVAAARFLAERDSVDPARLVVAGGSAGGFTTLAALVAEPDLFSAGISECGVADLEAFVGHTHKFESRYLERLVGPYPAAAETYRARSPIHRADRIRAPLLVLQGDDDRIVPPAQAEAIVAALRAAGVPYAYLLFEGEGHGFRGERALRRSLEAELSFLGQVLGFEPADPIEPVEVVGLEAWRTSRSARGPGRRRTRGRGPGEP